jgi:hypothetical protein
MLISYDALAKANELADLARQVLMLYLKHWKSDE